MYMLCSTRGCGRVRSHFLGIVSYEAGRVALLNCLSSYAINTLGKLVKIPSNFSRSECCRGLRAARVFNVDELIAEGLGFALQTCQHPLTILLFIRLLARVNVGGAIPQQALDQPRQLMRRRRHRFGRPQPSPHPSVIGP